MRGFAPLVRQRGWVSPLRGSPAEGNQVVTSRSGLRFYSLGRLEGQTFLGMVRGRAYPRLPHTERVSDRRLTLRDGRILAWREYGPSDGRPLLRFQGTPGSRNSRHPHEDAYERLNARVIVFDRPGYGASTHLPGRGVSVAADDAAELLDHLGRDVMHAIGGSGGGPHVLAFAARYPERVRAASVVVGGAILEEEDLGNMIELNRRGWYAAREGGWDAIYEILAPTREQIPPHPLAGFRAVVDTAERKG